MTTEIQTINTQVRPVLPYDIESAWRMAGYIAASGLAPKGIQSREAVFTAMQMGAEVGLSPMQALQNIAVINGRPSIWGDAQLGLVEGSGLLEKFKEWYEGEGEKLRAFTLLKRKGRDEFICDFSVDDAKKAGLWGKSGPWIQYPKRMLKMRARSFALRDGFADILKGVYSREEARDIPFDDITPNSNIAQTSDLNTQFLNIDPETGEITEQKNEIYPDAGQSINTDMAVISLQDRVHSMLAECALDASVKNSQEYNDLWQMLKASGDKELLGEWSAAALKI